MRKKLQRAGNTIIETAGLFKKLEDDAANLNEALSYNRKVLIMGWVVFLIMTFSFILIVRIALIVPLWQ